MREMTDAEIDAKHLRIRGTEAYKYHPMVSACKQGCGKSDDSEARKQRERRDHRCVLAIGHTGEHEWSSECQAMHVNSQPNEGDI